MQTSQHLDRIKRRIATVVWLVIGLLAFLTFSKIVDEEAHELVPSATESRPSGLRLFAELLRERGYKVQVTRNENFSAAKDDIVITPEVKYAFQIWSRQVNEDQFEKSAKNLARTELLISIPPDFNALVNSKTPVLAEEIYQPFQPYSPKLKVQIGEKFESDGGDRSLFTSKNGAVVTTTRSTGTLYAELVDGTPATNQFIGEFDNAMFMLTLIKNLAQPNSTIIFNESQLTGGARPSIYESIGRGAVAAYWQLILVIVVGGYMLSKRFGPATEDDIEVRSARSLLGAFGDTMYRAKRGDLALQLIYRHIDLRGRRAINLSPSASLKDRDSRLPQEAILAFHALQEASLNRLPLRKVAELARTAFQRLDEIESRARSRTR